MRGGGTWATPDGIDANSDLAPTALISYPLIEKPDRLAHPRLVVRLDNLASLKRIKPRQLKAREDEATRVLRCGSVRLASAKAYFFFFLAVFFAAFFAFFAFLAMMPSDLKTSSTIVPPRIGMHIMSVHYNRKIGMAPRIVASCRSSLNKSD